MEMKQALSSLVHIQKLEMREESETLADASPVRVFVSLLLGSAAFFAVCYFILWKPLLTRWGV